MCAVIGAYLKHPTEEQINTLKHIFLQSQIRGRHATGYSILQNGKVITRKSAEPAQTFIHSHFAEIQPGEHTLQFAGHCRYSTSDLRYNQPIQVFDDFALVHNGVVDQRPPIHWSDWGYDLNTANDSELIYHCARNHGEPLKEFPDASMAVAELSVDKGLRWYRNVKRPLYSIKVKNGYFVCSTQDIALRAGLKNPVSCSPGVVYTQDGPE